MRGLFDVIRPQAVGRGVVLRTDVSADLPPVMVDRSRFKQILYNLLSNAVKYTPDHGQIRLDVRREGDRILITVKDTGCGIPSEDVPKLFQEFYRSSDPINQEVKGTGLGLALVKRIVEAHQGRIWVESEQHKGSTFHVSLPSA